MAIEIRINWTPNQWRRFLGQPDQTPLVELTSVMIDKLALLVVDQRLEALTAELEGIEINTDSPSRETASGRGV